MKTITFDIETSALPAAQLAAIMPEFEPAANLKDPAKIEASIAAKRQAWLDDAALDAQTGKVLAIGIQDENGFWLIDGNGDEAELLREWWDVVQYEPLRVAALIGFNICNFDLPFLIRRSWHHSIPIPFGIRNGRYWGDSVVDLRDAWCLGDRMAKGSLDSIAKHLGLGAKTGNGNDFAQLLDTDRDKAVAYLKNDVELTAAIAKRLGIACQWAKFMSNPHQISRDNRLKEIPAQYRAKFIKAWEHGGFRAAVNAKCLDCCCYQRIEVRNCAAICCPLYEYRPYQTENEEE